MSAARSARGSSNIERACQQCQKRKTKCVPSRGSERCTFCSKAGKICVFTQPSLRTPLTRKNLDDAEARCRDLEALLRDHPARGAVHEGEGVRDTRHNSQVLPGDVEFDPSGNAFATTEAADSSPYEWTEAEGSAADMRGATSRLHDGMASLGNSSRGGYLGNSSGNSLLQTVSSALPAHAEGTNTALSDDDVARPEQGTGIVAPSLTWPLQMSATVIQDHLLSAYFRFYNSHYPVLHEAAFRARCATRNRLPASSAWHMLYYTVLAIGEWVSGFGGEEQSLYFEAARSSFRVDTLESGNMYTVQACLLIGNYLQKRDRPNTGFNFIGVAHRMALGLGLHRENGALRGHYSIALHRRRALFWTLYCFDSGFSITTGRPLLLPDAFIDVPVPLNADETEVQQPQQQIREVPYPTACSALIALSRLARVGNRFYQRLMSVEPCTDVDHQTSVMEQMMTNWRESLPSYFFANEIPEWFVGPRQVVFWKQANIRILLLLASQKQQTDAFEKLAYGKRYRAIAAGTIMDISSFCARHAPLHFGLSWYAVYFLLQATLALSAQQVLQDAIGTSPESEREQALASYQDLCQAAFSALQILSESDKAAGRSMRLLARLRHNVRISSTNPNADSDLGNGVPLNPSTTTIADPQCDQYQQASGVHPYPQSVAREDLGAFDFGFDGDFASDWTTTADPSFHMFLQGSNSIDTIFQDFNGFPGVAENDGFAGLRN